MEFGVHVQVTAEGMRAVEAGRLVEDLGFEAIFLGDHTHIPADVPPFHPLAVGHFSRFYDQLTALGAIGATTTGLRLGTGICLVNQREPIALAKATATIDDLSGGRLIFGVGAGGNDAELARHGVDPGPKFGMMRDRVRAITAIWTDEVAEYHGELVDIGVRRGACRASGRSVLLRDPARAR
jgi:alkanesulfonate monooxygenase SsuD/methylene tetrahydromethanopterin reductase-like flavin-dependent oxidoreductase (luciferase family)